MFIGLTSSHEKVRPIYFIFSLFDPSCNFLATNKDKLRHLFFNKNSVFYKFSRLLIPYKISQIAFKNRQ